MVFSFSIYVKNEFVFIFTFQLLPLATGKIYPSISKNGQHNPVVALEGYISAYSKCDFQIPHAKIYQNVSFQFTSSCETKDTAVLVLLRMLLSDTLGENGF